MSQGALKHIYEICFSSWAVWDLFSFFLALQFLFSSVHPRTSLYLISSLLHLLHPVLLFLLRSLCSHPFQYICFSLSCQLPALLRFPKELLDKLSTDWFLLPLFLDKAGFSSKVQHNGMESSETTAKPSWYAATYGCTCQQTWCRQHHTGLFLP